MNDTLQRLCIAVGVSARNIGMLPSDPGARESAAQAAITDYLAERPILRPEPGRTSLEWELRLLVRKAHEQLRRLDGELAAVTAQRRDLAELLKVKRR